MTCDDNSISYTCVIVLNKSLWGTIKYVYFKPMN
jgi:hypothetical protein